jgi:endonuclease/exonuclease/phosphatase (EEP) superfamily protein YafD
VISTHLVYNRYYGEPPGSLVRAARARALQVQRLLDHLATLDGPVIVCGDLNTAPNSVALSLLRERLADAWRLRGHGFGFTSSSTWPWRRIDYLLVRGIELGELQVLEQSLSDHRAVSAGFTLAASLATLGALERPLSSPER